MTKLLLSVGLAAHAVAWTWRLLPSRLSYWLRPYAWQLDARCWRWQRPAHLCFLAGDSSGVAPLA